MERGELEGYASVIYVGLAGDQTRLAAAEEDQAAALLRARKARPNSPACPTRRDAAGNEDDRILLEAAFAPLALGRPLVMPPGVPADRARRHAQGGHGDLRGSRLHRRERAAVSRAKRAAQRRGVAGGGRAHLRGTARRLGAAAPIARGAALTALSRQPTGEFAISSWSWRAPRPSRPTSAPLTPPDRRRRGPNRNPARCPVAPAPWRCV